LAWFRKKNGSHKKPGGSDAEITGDSNAASKAPEPDDAEKARRDLDRSESKPTPPPASETSPEGSRKGLMARLRKRLSKTRMSLSEGFDKVLVGKQKLDDEALEEIEELLITADIGVETTLNLMEKMAAVRVADPAEIKQVLKEAIVSMLQAHPTPAADREPSPRVVMVVGVNGVGKTTTIGKLAARAAAEGRQVLIAAADTFRAAAVEQLIIWSERAGAEIIKHKMGADPAAVAYDAVAAAQARGKDLVIIDTAGRLHTKVNLMEELKKVKRSIGKKLPEAPHEILLVLDATTGQNAIAQAKLFHEAIGVTGIALTKLDGTAKGGIVVGICNRLPIPLKYVGIGEQIEDLQDFDARNFVDALF
jgi:fused signal recognition particle receptor